ncbi:23S rRNA pseudouridine(955/2504/2580) synthase RluC [Buchnera aphidicola]|jgi:23S rRNA pseudouridine955/2504/2580 synthase|uniref:Ribosomal large subunit pseudouridine synthase C n=1 Tax=Buchnera aphidicola subsp. Schizaphis graminum (strain Sg) TaxID=198804 RepID=RLUC_BUCAP|nr:23S rRNA pseudouridine(955/2504/2580) synthase RluC [Buchnera aphidicola]Q8K9J8.1 RecName: Full=Ribosomal large subunit pseudouridine synthase C; AltName: Full=23S rRNA pseudouridine(955/2504/2580) synthase; AltName: Full=rRNA pseudouridylate synthase C; AltName: Full=rRNA-uridine isomerase C [Buchnera aphidicola str. Sg (Schizaphis graminum)]AAM67890.1 ribosomal large subunit pseudouridine synthase [Buchnera aphidicola str. Sg (Schizaphis graminum)]AWI49615.1 23S rRNA pseudouridine(955/2504/
MKYKTTSVSIIYINEDMINQRIDNFLQKKLKNVPRSMIYRIIRTGKIRINKKRIKPDYKLKIGDKLRIPPIKILCEKKSSLLTTEYKKNLLNNILYEDNYLLIINKPSGIAVHGGSGINLGVIEYFRKIRPLEKFLELVHRIDRDTSGVLMLAKKRRSLLSLHKQIREKKVQKKYIALVHGLWPLSLRKVSEPLLKTHLKNKQRKILINKEGKPAETYFKIKKQYLFTTLVSITPKTGRTHQIRVHTLHAGHPILFDKRYGKRDLDCNIKNKTKINRLLLHATSINFIHPETGKKMHIVAPLDVYFKNYLNTLI